MLFDLQIDPGEMHDLGDTSEHADTTQRLVNQLNAWYRQHHNKTTVSDADVIKRENGDLRRGIFLGFWDQADLDEAHRTGRTGN